MSLLTLLTTLLAPPGAVPRAASLQGTGCPEVGPEAENVPT